MKTHYILLMGLCLLACSDKAYQREGQADTSLDSNAGDGSADGSSDAADTREDERDAVQMDTADIPTEEDTRDTPQQCDPAHARCVDENTLEVCEDGELSPRECDIGEVCTEDRCARVVCTPGEVLNCARVDALELCNETGTGGGVVQECEEGDFCRILNDEFACTDQICDQGERRCRNNETVEECAEDGTEWFVSETCPPGLACDENECRSLCDINSKVSSFLGCEYWSMDLDNIEGGITSAHAVIISNPSAVEAMITVRDGDGNELDVRQWPTSVPPGGVATWVFDSSYRDRNTNDRILDPAAVNGTVLTNQSWQFEASVPITAHQFSPLVGAEIYTNDASLLLPTNAVGKEYFAMSWKHRDRRLNLRGFVTVLGIDEEPTTVTITPSVTVIAGRDEISDQVINQINAGEPREFVLAQGQLINLETLGPAGEDLTGTHIVADRPVVAFGGHECGNVDLGIDRCDHIEHQLFPVNTWGTSYVGTKFSPRAQEPDIWRILASENQTQIQTDPPIENVDGRSLDRGEFLEFQWRGAFVATGTRPISVGHYMVGANWATIPRNCPGNGGPTGIGDPAMTLAPPIDQWRADYIVLVPPDAYEEDYLNVIVRLEATVTLDGELIPESDFVLIGDTGYAVATLRVEDGPKTLIGSEPFGLEAYGYDCHVSYAYPGGLNLQALNRP
jgi:hypothetical protein